MPFTKIGRNTYQSPSGRQFNQKQVALYYANGGKFPGEENAGAERGVGQAMSEAAAGKATRTKRMSIGRQKY